MRRVLLALLILVLLPGAGKVTLPDVRDGNIDGKAAMLHWPATMPVDAKHDPSPLPTAAGCEVVLVPHTDANQELRYPCGKWFAPPANAYNVWLETNGNITPNPVMARYSGSPFAGHGFAAITPVAPAGRVAIPADRTLPEREGLRLLSIEADHSWNRNARLFDRRVSARKAKTPVQMPAGRVIAGRFDTITSDAIALSKPIRVKQGETTYVWPAPPIASDVLLVLDKPRELQLQGSASSRVALNDRAPDVYLDAFERLIAVWYGVDARTATISLKSDAAFWPAREIRLAPGKVTTVRSRLERLPSAVVSVIAPPDAKLPEETALEISRPSDEKVLRRMQIAAGDHELTALPPEPLRFTLSIGEWKLDRDVDFTAGADEKVVFELQPMSISGTVFYGDDPAPADITFLNRGEWATTVRTNERGQYRTTLWWPKSHSMKLALLDGSVPPYIESFRDIFGSGTVDFHIPRTDYVVHVRDASTGRGIAGARVSAGNLWLDADSRERASSGHVVADENGRAVLPPLQAGEVIIEAEAERYGKMEPLRVRVDRGHHEIDVALPPLRVASRVQLSLPGGSPAANAEIWAFDAAMQPLWRAKAGIDGGFDIPENANGSWLVIRHANAATSVRRWDGGEVSVAWRLDPPAEPLTVMVERRMHRRRTSRSGWTA